MHGPPTSSAVLVNLEASASQPRRGAAKPSWGPGPATQNRTSQNPLHIASRSSSRTPGIALCLAFGGLRGSVCNGWHRTRGWGQGHTAGRGKCRTYARNEPPPVGRWVVQPARQPSRAEATELVAQYRVKLSSVECGVRGMQSGPTTKNVHQLPIHAKRS